ncbi:hypothetical protein MD484_g5479, partial [Candolleomyces efflorescens]
MAVLGRIQAFLPELEASNRALLERAQADPSSVDIENVKEGEARYIEMNLGLGVYEERQRSQRRTNGEGPSSIGRETQKGEGEGEMEESGSVADSDSDSTSDLDSSTAPADPVSSFFQSLHTRQRRATSSGSSSDSSSSSTTTSEASGSESDSDSDLDSDSDSDLDSDSSSDGPTIPVSERLIKPLPKRTRKPPLIEVLGESPTETGGGEMGTRNHHGVGMNHNPLSPKTVYRQDDSQGPIYNGTISGGVNTAYSESGGSSFSTSHDRSTFGKVVNAGNDVFMPSLQFVLNSPILEADSPTRSNGLFQKCVRSLFSFFQSPEIQDSLHHSLPGEAPSAANTVCIQVQLPRENVQERRDTHAEDFVSHGESSEDAPPLNSPEASTDESEYSVSSMSELDLRLLQSQVTTNAEIYTRSPRGIVPGDVGTFDLTYGFKKIFNIWEDECAGSWELPAQEIARSDHFSEGYTIVSGAYSKIHRSEDDRYIQSFEFECITEQGAVLACTTSADVEELDDIIALRDFLVQHAGVVYQRANSLRRLAEEDSLYIVTGSVKTDSWGLAAYQGAASGVRLKLSKRYAKEGSTRGAQPYEWTDRGTAEARFGLNSSAEEDGPHGGKNQSLFLRGFKLAFSRSFRAREGRLKHADSVTDLLLRMTGADCALSHDNDWTHSSTSLASCQDVDGLFFQIIAPKAISVLGVHLLDPDEVERPDSAMKSKISIIRQVPTKPTERGELGVDVDTLAGELLGTSLSPANQSNLTIRAAPCSGQSGDLDQKIILEALNGEDRFYVLGLGKEMESLIKEQR